MTLKALSFHEKLAYFYCQYVREEAVDPETDADAVRWWEKIRISKRKSKERMCLLLNQIENTSAAHVRHLDATFRAKRELLLLAEGTIGCKPGSTSSSKPRSSHNAAVLTQLEVAQANNELLQECGALQVFSQALLRSIEAFRSLNFQHLDVDAVDSMIHDLQQDMVLLYLLIVFNVHKHHAIFERQLYVIGTSAPSFALVTILDCLCQLNVLPGFPIKRLLMLCTEWLSAILGDFDVLEKLKYARRSHHTSDKSVLRDEANGIVRCKTFASFHDRIQLDPQDPYYLQKKKFSQIRQQLHQKYLHQPHHTLACKPSSESDMAGGSLDALDDEWQSRCEVVYQLFLPRMREYSLFLGNLVTISCGSALHARDKKTFYSRRPSHADNYNPNDGDNQYWKWILREKTIVLDVCNLLILLILKHFRASHVYKGEYFANFMLEANVLATLTKFMNKDLGAYLQVSKQETDELKTGFTALEAELERLIVRNDEDLSEFEFSIQATRTMTSILRILQKLTKRKPTIIKNALCRSASIVWLKRVVSLKIPVPRLYALKLVKSQAKYLGHQWLRKYTCINLLTEVYLYVRPELEDDWLQYEDDDLNKPPSQESVERLIFGEVQVYHHKYYWDSLPSSKPTANGASMVCEAQKELESEAFDVEGGRVIKFFNDMKLDPVHFCPQYEKWLDQEGLVAASASTAASMPLSIAFS